MEGWPTDHAGGGLSSHLSLALTLSRDGIVGRWNGNAEKTPEVIPGVGLDYLTPALRGDLLDQELCAALVVTPGRDTGKVAMRPDRPLVTLHRPSHEQFGLQMPVLRCYADLREDRMPEILEQTEDLLSFFGTIHQLDDTQRRWTLELLEAVVRLAILVEMPLKHGFRTPRPIAFSQFLQPPIQTPVHGTYPSGHATEAFAMATVLHHLATDRSAATAVKGLEPLFVLAHRIAENRTVAGVHFPHDSLAGALLGVALGEWVVASASGKRCPGGREYRPADKPPDPFKLETLAALLGAEDGDAVEQLPILTEVWQAAAGEWIR